MSYSVMAQTKLIQIDHLRIRLVWLILYVVGSFW